MDFNGYLIHVTKQTLPHLASPWTRIEIGNKSFKFQRDDSDKTKVFTISGYIQEDTVALTIAEAVGLNNALIASPSGTYTDGWGTTYTCIVDDWEIDLDPVQNKCPFSMSLRVL